MSARISQTISKALGAVHRRKRTAANSIININATNVNVTNVNNISIRNLSSYEYPNRTEAPIITRSLASSKFDLDTDIDIDIDTDTDSNANSNANANANANANETPNTSYNNNNNNNNNAARVHPDVDPFDDTNSFSPEERRQILQQQKSSIKTTLPKSFSIQPTPPSSIPPNLPRTAMTTPTTQITTLPNGIRVASQETYGQVTTFGLLSNCGSRLESTQNRGVNHLMELLAFGGTPSLTSTDLQTKLDNLGGFSFASSSREQFLYCIDVLRPNVKEAMGLLRDVVLEPRLDDETVDMMKRTMEFQWMEVIPELVLGEGLQVAGYGAIDGQGQQLGKSHYCPLDALPHLDAEVVRQFRNKNLLNPENLVVAGAGIQHDVLVEMAEENFGHLLQDPTCGAVKVVPSAYTGGYQFHTAPNPDEYTRVALAFPTGGWHSDDLVPACVLQTLLGGGSSFSAGGPGKGMYSRLYRKVLNRYSWAESCEAFTSFHSESGLLGISGSAVGRHAGDMTLVLAENIMKLAEDEVDDEELDRARNMLKNNVLTQLESRLVLFEDIGRQILTYGHREGTAEMCAKIDAVDKKVLRDLVRKSLTGMKPTLVSVGDEWSKVPAFEEVERWFGSYSK